MKRYIVPILMIASPLSAGGISGGGGVPALQNMDTLALLSASLPKGYAEPEDLRRASIRLGETGVETTDLKVDGDLTKVRKLSGSVVVKDLCKEVLPIR